MSNFSKNIDSLYGSWRPAFNNLFEVTLYNDDAKTTTSADTAANDYMKLHAIKVSFGDETLDLQRDNITKNFRIKDNYAYKRSDILKITFRENDAFDVKKYHEDWMESIYSRNNDAFRVFSKTTEGADIIPNVYRTVDVTMGPSGNKTCIRFYNVIPKNIPGLDLAWGPSGQIIQSTIQYYVESWEWVDPVEETTIDDTNNTGSGNNNDTTTAGGK